MNKIILIVFLLLVSVSMGFGQSKGIMPLHKFFQQYADSTIVMEYDNDSYDNNAYLIISKTEKFVNCFKYDAVDPTTEISNRDKEFPKMLWAQIISRKMGFRSNPPDINVFFGVVHVDSAKAANLWKEMQGANPWQLKDDQSIAENNKDFPESRAIIMDGGYSILHLITKSKIETLNFYAPYFYEERYPGNKNRQSIIKINRLFLENYPKILSVQ